MPPSPTVAARNARIRAGHATGATILELARAEQVDPAVVRRVLRAGGIEPTPEPLTHPTPDSPWRARLADPAWLAAQYATKTPRQIARELACPRDAVYEALHAADVRLKVNGRGLELRPLAPETSERIVSLYPAGSSLERVATEMGPSIARVNSVLEERGVKRSRNEVAALAHAGRGEPAAGKRPREWPPELEAEVLGRYAEGESGEAIAESLGLTASSVYRLLRARGVLRSRAEAGRVRESRQPGPGPASKAATPEVREVMAAELAEEVAARYGAGEPPRAIAVVLGVPASRVYRVLKERGVLRSRSEARRVAHQQTSAQ